MISSLSLLDSKQLRSRSLVVRAEAHRGFQSHLLKKAHQKVDAVNKKYQNTQTLIAKIGKPSSHQMSIGGSLIERLIHQRQKEKGSLNEASSEMQRFESAFVDACCAVSTASTLHKKSQKQYQATCALFSEEKESLATTETFNQRKKSFISLTADGETYIPEEQRGIRLLTVEQAPAPDLTLTLHKTQDSPSPVAKPGQPLSSLSPNKSYVSLGQKGEHILTLVRESPLHPFSQLEIQTSSNRAFNHLSSHLPKEFFLAGLSLTMVQIKSLKSGKRPA